MGNLLTTFIFSISVATWVYSKVQRRNGGISQQSLTAAVVVGIMAFIFFLSILTFITNYLES